MNAPIRGRIPTVAAALLTLLAAACAGSTQGTAQPTTATSPSQAAAVDPYRAAVAAQWPAIATAFAAAPCDKRDSKGMPVDQPGCTAGTTALIALAKKLRADIEALSPPAGRASEDTDLKIALDDLNSRLAESNQAIDRGDGAAFAQAGLPITEAYQRALVAKTLILR
jgi:hypothetical protein